MQTTDDGSGSVLRNHREGVAVLDVRPAEAFAAGHLPGAVSLPLDGADVDHDRLARAIPSLLLPPRHEPLLVVAESGEFAADVAAHLEGRGRVPVESAAWPEGGPPGVSLRTGESRARLWRPPPWLAAHAPLLPPPAHGPTVDFGCGSGRAAVWLAEAGYRVLGLDHQPEALEMGRWLAARQGVACDFAAADLRSPESWPAGPWSVLLNFRFLHRPLLEAAGRLLRPGGVAMVRTFRDAPGYDGHPHPRHRLRRHELLDLFPRGSFEILAHAEDNDPDGRPAAGIVARRL